ncbi:ribonucleoside-diphosphate reductase large subunit [Elysia marginata]|uniref:Ribonucleoside-diphosphate reductase large subunit n=1 Tax=Elysia marginata TaxID=1093978 RepID=A0AAV4FRE8_9GAST|nr:ribonucleoside-diphosphate reductase large subunit [Elysia marginata]
MGLSEKDRRDGINHIVKTCRFLSGHLPVRDSVIMARADGVMDLFESPPTASQLNNNFSYVLSKDKDDAYLALAARLKMHELCSRVTWSFERALAEHLKLGEVAPVVNTMYAKHKARVDELMERHLDDDYEMSYDDLVFVMNNYLIKDRNGTVVDRPVFFFMRTALHQQDRMEDVADMFLAFLRIRDFKNLQ